MSSAISKLAVISVKAKEFSFLGETERKSANALLVSFSQVVDELYAYFFL